MKLRGSEVAFVSPVFRVYRERWEARGATLTRDVVRHRTVVAVLPETERGTYLLVRQFRFPVRVPLVEVPAGFVEPGETAEEAAARELLEETGHEATRLERLAEVYTSPGFTDERVTIFMARARRSARAAHGDEDEVVELVEFTRSALAALADAGGIVDGKTLLALVLAGVVAPFGGERP